MGALPPTGCRSEAARARVHMGGGCGMGGSGLKEKWSRLPWSFLIGSFSLGDEPPSERTGPDSHMVFLKELLTG